MNMNRHLTQEERNIIEQRFIGKESFKCIGRELDKDPTTIAKEVKNHIQFKRTGCYGRPFNDCLHRRGCPVQHLCDKPQCNRNCCFCSSLSCSSMCADYRKKICQRLLKPPYVCNGCEDKNSCTLEKRIYSATHAQREYETVRSESRQGLQITEEEVLRLDSLISPLLRKGQSLHHICINHIDEIMLDERSLYNYVDAGLFLAKNIDMPRVVRMGRRQKKKDVFKLDKKCRLGRIYQDFLKYMAECPGLPIVITLMMNHLNSYGRPNLGEKTPYEIFTALYGEEILRGMGAELISPDKITLHPSLLKK